MRKAMEKLVVTLFGEGVKPSGVLRWAKRYAAFWLIALVVLAAFDFIGYGLTRKELSFGMTLAMLAVIVGGLGVAHALLATLVLSLRRLMEALRELREAWRELREAWRERRPEAPRRNGSITTMLVVVLTYLLGIIFPVGYFGGVLLGLLPPDFLVWAILSFVVAFPIWGNIIGLSANRKTEVSAFAGAALQLLLVAGLVVATGLA